MPTLIVFVGDGRAEESQNTVAHQACNHTFVTVDRFDQVLESAVDDIRPFLGIELPSSCS
jgi:hypothetical protein